MGWMDMTFGLARSSRMRKIFTTLREGVSKRQVRMAGALVRNDSLLLLLDQEINPQMAVDAAKGRITIMGS